jgi:GNAT superfamily N-acetyltransferase
MEILEQIREICIETDNKWLFSHSFPRVALNDLLLAEKCEVESIRNEAISKLGIKNISYIYDYNTGQYVKSKWIIPEKKEGKIPGFMLIKCTGSDVDSNLFTHGIEFVCVRPEYRKKGILKNMLNKLPKDWNIWLEASNKEIENIKDIWKKCGFEYHETIGNSIIYKKIQKF